MPLIIGVDVGGEGEDLTVVTARRGHVVLYQKVVPKDAAIDLPDQAQYIIKVILNHAKPALICVDSCGIGFGLYGNLKAHYGGHIVKGINAGHSANDGINANMKALMWSQMAEWIADPASCLPQCEQLRRELASMVLGIRGGGLRFMVDTLSKSPDYADSLALTFGETVPFAARHDMHSNKQVSYTQVYDIFRA